LFGGAAYFSCAGRVLWASIAPARGPDHAREAQKAEAGQEERGGDEIGASNEHQASDEGRGRSLFLTVDDAARADAPPDEGSQ